MTNNFDLTKYKYFRPKNAHIGFYGTNHIFLLDSPKDYHLSPNTIYQILDNTEKVYSLLDELYPGQNKYRILDLKTMKQHNLMILKKHKFKDIEQFMELYE